MSRKLFRILRHAVTMVRRNLRSYAMLSVTIVISFSLLLGYLGLMDSTHYNKYKTVFAQDRNMLSTRAPNAQSQISHSMAELMQKRASEYGTVQSTQLLRSSFYWNMDNLTLETGEELSFFEYLRTICIPRQSWCLYEDPGYPLEVNWVDGKEHPNYDLKSGEIILEEELYYALGLDQGDRTIVMELFHSNYHEDHVLTKAFTVVGTVDSDWELEIELKHNDMKNKDEAYLAYNSDTPICVFPLEDLNPTVAPNSVWWRYVSFYTDEPELVKEMIKAMDSSLVVYAVYEQQNRALETIQTEKGTKAMVAMILLLLLGINLYSSFDNALNDRKFEIGVKRAVGASAFSIVRQFFYEGLVVMVVDILLSVAIVTDIAIAYKFIREAIPDQFGIYEHYVLYISPYSIAIFVICALVLTVVFSFVFAYKSTQVQIVDYLKAE